MDLHTADHDISDRHPFAEQGSGQKRPDTNLVGQCPGFRKLGLNTWSKSVLNVDGLSIEDRFASGQSSDNRSALFNVESRDRAVLAANRSRSPSTRQICASRAL